ncbi:hypothetical protein Tco_0073189 [Tanacetum coccineum]
MYPEIKQLAIKRVDEYGFVIRLDLVRLTSGSVGPFYSINTVPVIRFSLPERLKADNTVRIYQKSQENRQKRANTDTRNGRAQKKPDMQSQELKAKSKSQTLVKTKGFSKLKVKDDNSKALQHNGRVNYVKSRALIDHLSIKATWLWKKAQGEVGFTLGSLREVAQAVTSRMTAWQSVYAHS